ncbi:MAG: putative flavoprotein involved in transport [Actinomycetota bacterium]|jgi:putative flavoprotein involved in K+ transport|nr:putative flavoprotein involved in transport [Actinomycetota bacterium]
MNGERERKDRVETVIIGGGQAGLSVGYHLTKRGREFLILDANERIGDSWRKRWDSLRVFTPARADGLAGLPFPAPPWSFPTKDEIGDYFEAYVERFQLPVETEVRVDGISKEEDRYVVACGDRRIEADNVVVATGACRNPKVPMFAPELDPRIVQLHSSEYRSSSQLLAGDVLLVGAGNSGAEIARELSPTRTTWLAGKEPGHIPARHGSIPFRVLFRVIRFIGTHILTMGTPIGRKARPKFVSHGTPLIRVRPKDLAAAGIKRVGKITGIKEGKPLVEGGQVLDVANVIWCTGFRSDFSWIQLPVFDPAGEPEQVRGVVAKEPGLYFVGLLFLYAATSDVLPGVGRDAEYIANHIDSRMVTAGAGA